jgi:hypothetical protein
MCWEHVDRAGVFQSTQAAEVVAVAIAEIRQRMKDAPPQQAEPVAWMVYTLDGKSVCVTDNPADFTDQHRALPLYASALEQPT